MILEGIVTTLDEDRGVRIAPMGPSVVDDFTRLIFRPFQSSRTYHNLKRSGQGVFHVTDDVLLMARSVLNQLTPLPPVRPSEVVDGVELCDACRWYAFRVESIRTDAERATMECRVVASDTLRPFFGFNRAKHAVVEAAILATRVHIHSPDAMQTQLQTLAPLVEKTGGADEKQAFRLLSDFIRASSQPPAAQQQPVVDDDDSPLSP